MKKVLITLVFMMCFILPVKASTIIGTCTYTKDSDNTKQVYVNVYDDGKVKTKGFDWVSDEIKDNYAKKLNGEGTCYKYVWFKDKFIGGSEYIFTDNTDDNSGDRYTLVGTKKANCSYDIKYGNANGGKSDTFVRLNFNLKENGSRVFANTLNTDSNYVGLSNLQGASSVSWFIGEQKSHVITYDLSQTNKTNMQFEAGALTDIYGYMKDGVCPVIKATNDNGSLGYTDGLIIIQKDDTMADGYGEYQPSNTYNTKKDNTVSSIKDRGSTSVENAKPHCELNGVTSMGDATDEFSFNLQFKVSQYNYKQFCVQIDEGYHCTDENDAEGYKYGFAVKPDPTSSAVPFLLDEDLKDYVEKMNINNFVCPSGVKVFKDGFGYIFTTRADAAGDSLVAGENDNTGGTVDYAYQKQKLEQDKEGTEITLDCEGLIGPNTLEFLRILRNIIMIAGPILAVILGTYDMIQAMASGEDDAKKKGLKRLKGRLIAAALLLLAPYIIFLLVQISPAVGKDCINQVSYIVSDTINILK